MMHLFINGLGASAGSGPTYLKNTLPQFSKAGVRVTVAINSEFAAGHPTLENIHYLPLSAKGGAAQRFWLEQKDLPGLIRQHGADILLSAGNFALRNSPVPQILLSGNSLYTCRSFFRDLMARHEYRMWLATQVRTVLAKRSVTWANCTVAPSQAFAGELEEWTDRPIVALHHGFDSELFTSSRQPLSEEMKQKLNCPPRFLRLLFVSHYNYYRNFETLFRAIAKLRERPGLPEVRLFLTCELDRAKTPGAYNPEPASRLIDEIGIRKQVVELGAVPYEQLHHVYGACHIYVTPAYTETFAHPLVEAMSCGLPVLASDLPVHREICGNAALHFSRFSPAGLAHQLSRLASSDSLRESLSAAALARSRTFSWEAHVQRLLALAEKLLGSSQPSNDVARSVSAA